jgi:hypothetical protein
VCEAAGLDFWEQVDEIGGAELVQEVVSAVLRAKGHGTEEVGVRADPAKDPRGHIMERVFRSDFI